MVFDEETYSLIEEYKNKKELENELNLKKEEMEKDFRGFETILAEYEYHKNEIFPDEKMQKDKYCQMVYIPEFIIKYTVYKEDSSKSGDSQYKGLSVKINKVSKSIGDEIPITVGPLFNDADFRFNSGKNIIETIYSLKQKNITPETFENELLKILKEELKHKISSVELSIDDIKAEIKRCNAIEDNEEEKEY